MLYAFRLLCCSCSDSRAVDCLTRFIVNQFSSVQPQSEWRSSLHLFFSCHLFYSWLTQCVFALSGWSDCCLWLLHSGMWTYSRLRCEDSLQGARVNKNTHTESKPLFKQNDTDNRPQQMVKLGSEPHPPNRHVKNIMPLIRLERVRSCFRNDTWNLYVSHISDKAIKTPAHTDAIGHLEMQKNKTKPQLLFSWAYFNRPCTTTSTCLFHSIFLLWTLGFSSNWTCKSQECA